jgi:LysW-gamma-L-lysine carboxypeptidase
MTHLLTELVRRYSPSMQEGEAVAYLVEWMNAHGFAAHIDEAGNAFGVRGEVDASNTLLLLGHIDTYPGDLPVRVENGVLYGRGSVDAKGCLCAFAEATAAARIPSGWRVIVVGAVEEEAATSKGAHHLRATLPEPTLCIIGEPSGTGRITLGYKGRLVLEYRVAQTMAHTARNEASAGARAVAFWNAVEAWAAAYNAGKTKAFEQVQTHLRAINTTTDYLSETCVLAVSLRLPPDMPPDAALAAVTDFCEGGELIAYGLERAYIGEKSNALVRGLLTAIRLEAMQPSFVMKTGTSDMNVVGGVWTCPIVAYGPGDSSLDHTPDEQLVLAEYEKAVRVLRRVIEGY